MNHPTSIKYTGKIYFQIITLLFLQYHNKTKKPLHSNFFPLRANKKNRTTLIKGLEEIVEK